MNINRHNYEEFFLLYVDNELGANERSLVEKFVQENPDLSEELEMLQQVVLSDELVHFDDKEQLYKKEEGISRTNYEEFFLLAVDNELSETEKHEVEKFVLKHPGLQNDFTLLQQTKLEAVPIAFPHKEDLYRQETKRRVIPIAWARMSVAAAILGLAIAIWMVNTPSNTQPGLVDKGKPAPPRIDITNTPAVKQPAPQQPVAEERVRDVADNVVKAGKAAPTKTEVALPAPQKNIQPEKNVASNNRRSVNETKVNVIPNTTGAEDKVITLPEPKLEEAPAVASSKKNNIAPKVVEETPAQKTFTNYANVKDEPVLAAHTVYREIDTDEEEKSVYIGAAKINKNKLKGLFKKASGLLEKKLGKNSDDEFL